MKNELAVIDPKEFGIKEKSAKSIESAFAPSISERIELSKKYDLLISQEITPELIDEITILDKQLQKCEKSIFNTHKSQKDYSLQLGRFIDSWKNKETAPIKQMREKCKEAKNHFDNIEKERIKKIGEQRLSELEKYEVEEIPEDIGHMPESIYKSFLSGSKISFKEKKAEEKRIEEKRIESEKLQKQFDERYKEMLPYSDFLDISLLTVDTSFEEYSNSLNLAIKSKKFAEEKAVKQAEENERLKKEAEEREKQESKRTKQLEIDINNSRDKRRVLAIEFLLSNDFVACHGGHELIRYGHFICALNYCEFDKDSELENFKERILSQIEKYDSEKQRILDIEERELIERTKQRESDALIEKERKEKQEAQDKLDAIEKQKSYDLEREKSKGDKEHIQDLINSLEAIKSGDKFNFKSQKNLVMFANVQNLIQKTVDYIKK